MLLHLETQRRDGEPRWAPPLVRTVAARGDGVPALLDACDAHRVHLAATGEGARRAATHAEQLFSALLREQALMRVLCGPAADARVRRRVAA